MGWTSTLAGGASAAGRRKQQAHDTKRGSREDDGTWIDQVDRDDSEGGKARTFAESAYLPKQANFEPPASDRRVAF
jgi:hypothetical protein